MGGVIAVIPARGGSKRIPRKNVRPFLGQPMIARTIQTINESQVFDRVLVSTDDAEIERVAVSAGAEAPFRRPRELADDHTGTGAVVRHAIGELERAGEVVSKVCLVYPTAVLTTTADIRSSLDQLDDGNDYVLCATGFDAPIERALRRLPDGRCEMIWPEQLMSRSQDLEPAYHDAGQFYWGWRDAWMASRPVLASNTQMFVVPRWRTQDIDDIDDWHRAELLYEAIARRS